MESPARQVVTDAIGILNSLLRKAMILSSKTPIDKSIMLDDFVETISDEENFDWGGLDDLAAVVPASAVVKAFDVATGSFARDILCRICCQRIISGAAFGLISCLDDEDMDVRNYSLEALAALFFMGRKLPVGAGELLSEALSRRLREEKKIGLLSSVVQLLPFAMGEMTRSTLLSLEDHEDSRVKLQARRGIEYLDRIKVEHS
ncbi:hypothetical protein [Embleya sp. NBC_00896]|uniref:hypothetical protein n=1 Tax=Embleya sp. NBC_00896 TaxID=2975961 RepID=UPI00386C0148|nr:hypothetical protein OG928_32355 [Embleya sp. NBC_00896]